MANRTHDTPVTALLGPTNTGKTYRALDRMLAHQSGVMGFPLRLLARENYDRAVALKGADSVALVTGEEKIIPPGARYFLCTAESMPLDRAPDFLAVDEIQLCADPDRGHIFTDRLLRARGTAETMFMGAQTMQGLIGSLLPQATMEMAPRFSELRYTGYRNIARLPKRSAVVAFSMNDVYAIAEQIRRQRGGTAVVLGALSPRTRNAQVEMYQAGEVDFLVATDAIGMGLNMDIHHVALASLRKFDGRRRRPLRDAEIAQIAGRAGRYRRDGTFGVTAGVKELDPESVSAIENHVFPPCTQIYWRNPDLDFASPRDLIKSLEKAPPSKLLARGNPGDDYLTLQALSKRDEVRALAEGDFRMRLLWDVCQVPDFRQSLSDAHYELAASLYKRLCAGRLPEDWVAAQVGRLSSVQGDVDTLMTRLAHVRTWTYIAYKAEWLERSAYWQERTRALEDKLSDALHEALIARFVDRRAAALIGGLAEGRALLAGVQAGGEVLVEGHLIGQLQGFRFIPYGSLQGAEAKAVMAAARTALQSEIKHRLKTMLSAADKQFKLMDDGKIFFQPDPTNPLPGDLLAEIRKGTAPLRPQAEIVSGDLLQGTDKSAARERVEQWLAAHIAHVLQPLVALVEGSESQAGPVRGICFQIHEAMGIVPREQIEDLISGLDPAMRQELRARKIRLGPVLVFLPDLNRPAAVRLRALLWSLWQGKLLPAAVPFDGSVSVRPDAAKADPAFYQAIGYPLYGPRAVRIDMLDRVISAVYDSAKDGKFQARHEMAEWLGCPIDDLYAVLEAMGHRKMQEQPVQDAPAPESAAPESAAEELPQAPASAQGDLFAAPAHDKPAAPDVPKPAAAAKPPLAFFRLKKGKANAKYEQRPHKKPFQGNSQPDKAGRPSQKPFDAGHKRDKKRFQKPQRPQRDETPRVIEARPKGPAPDSPFAVLEQLKAKRDA